MDTFSYHNIFETKGIEYLVVIAFLLLLIPFWFALNKKIRISGTARKRAGILSAGILKIPHGIFYSRHHTWAYLEMSGIARIGLDDFLLHITGSVNFGNLKSRGEIIHKGDLMAEIRQGDKSLSIYAPVSGEILSTNPHLTENPELLSDDPYSDGWMYKIRPIHWTAETPSCLFAEDASKWFEKELERFKDFLSGAEKQFTPESDRLILQDGGELYDHTLSELPAEVWKNFQKNFLNSTNSTGRQT